MNSPRRFPRTLNEAFPRTAEYGAAIEVPCPSSRIIETIAGWALAVFIGLSLVAVFGPGVWK